ncbi:MAG: DUF6377 domain-containing protein [Lachnoclostridium sp.]|nr:DUF6377 domain-containing protein [Lachnoclostridium sp.]
MPRIYTLLLSFIIGFFSFLTSAASLPDDTDKLLKIIDSELLSNDSFTARKYAAIDSINIEIDSLKSGQERLKSLLHLGRLLGGVDSDSAVVVFRRGSAEALELNDTVMTQKFLINTALQLHYLGLDGEGFSILHGLDKTGVKVENLQEYNEALIVVNMAFYNLFPNSNRRSYYLNRAVQAAQETLDILGKEHSNENPFKMYKAFIAGVNGDISLMVAILNEILEKSPITDRSYSPAAEMFGDYYRITGNPDEAIKMYALGAIADLKNSYYQGDSQIYLAKLLYERGDISRAYNYLTNALGHSINVGSKMNQMLISESLKPVADDFRNLENRRLMVSAILSCVLVIALAFILKMVVSLRREMTSLKIMRQRLSDANIAKETYITQYLSLCSTFLERLEDFSRTCRRKLTAGQTEDLLAFIKSGKTIEEQRAAFYTIFDDTFIHIYPTFVNDVNELLLPDRKISVTGNTSLTPELRILAFQRLGIDDASKVARFLGLSLNTIYTYRNKIRSRAIDRDNFDRDLMNIGIIH